MKIELKNIFVADLVRGYVNDDDDGGVVAYGGLLDVRPPYQREFVYSPLQQQMVIDTVYQGFPLNVMYWASREDGSFEVLDGQQRTLSICEFVEGNFSVKIGDDMLSFSNLQDDQQKRILNYELSVYVCTGDASEKLQWFRRINIAGAVLTDQEIRNAIYHGAWLSDAKRYFSKNGCPAYKIGKDYLTGSPIRQDFLETAIRWVAPKGNIEVYMSQHQHDANASELWQHYQAVIAWVEATIRPSAERKKIMKGVDWGALYCECHNRVYDHKAIEAEVVRLILDDDVTNKRGIYPYIFTRHERCLSIRVFSDAIKLAAYERQDGHCANPDCQYHTGGRLQLAQMEADHITPWSLGGHTVVANCQMLCKECNRRKSGK